MTHRSAAVTRPWMALVCVLSSLLFIAACADRQREPARQAIMDIEAAVNAAGTEPVKYVPHLVSDVASQVAVLKTRFENEDYAGVLLDAPEVLAAARELPVAAAARRDELHAALRLEWQELAGMVPAEIEATRNEAERLLGTRPLPKGITPTLLDSTRKGIDDARALWEQAVAQQAANHLEEAVTLGNQARERSRSIRVSLGTAPDEVSVK